MKHTFIVLFVFLSLTALAQKGTVKESLTIPSTILGKDVKYNIYLPADYQASNRSYPILYLLHGFGDDETGWVQFGEANSIADRMIENGEAAPMIIAMPDGGVTGYVNSFDGKVRYEDFFINEFIPYIESHYRVRSQKRYRAIAGLSMGGYGTLIMSTKHPDLFAAAAPLSAGVRTDDEVLAMPDAQWASSYAQRYGSNLVGAARLNAHYQKNSILKIVETANPDEIKKVRYYIDCGDDDFLIKGNMALHALMIDKKIPHEFRVRQGGHTWTYWRTALPEVLKFVSESFHQK
ncbi:esterase family protein [Emticicia sp. 21SJ11W-3]|uniref:alpha/beta hydrolase n=1 Tax=Emticicia sp. 21SJ11W-3 TaxID=2916755 RepID=UPI0020A0719E|nr:alpha/beta hydrolase-fold protein [Emticicia sp. 21SJ11W-3]UTA68830.1 esterase family protein [Emticicia sp. 21SJ11W-3]